MSSVSVVACSLVGSVPILRSPGVSRTSVTDGGLSLLQSISAETSDRYFMANRLHSELALSERPTASVRTGTVQDRIYKGYHRLWPEASGWEGSFDSPSYRVHVCGDPSVVEPVTRTRAHGFQHEECLDSASGIIRPDRFPAYVVPTAESAASQASQKLSQEFTNIPSKRFVSATAPKRARSRKTTAVADDVPPQGESRQKVLLGMLIREAINEKSLTADSPRNNVAARITHDKKVKAQIDAAAPAEPAKVGMFGRRPGQPVQEDQPRWHVPITKAGHRDKGYGDRAKYNATNALTTALTGCQGLVSPQSSVETSLQVSTSSTASQRSSFFSSQSLNAFSVPATPHIQLPGKPLSRLASAMPSSGSDGAPPVKKATGYSMFRKR